MDRFVGGFSAGVAGGILKILWSTLSSNVLHFAKLSLPDWASVMIFGRPAASMMETIIATIGYLFFVGVLGVIFAYLITAINSSYYLFKGVVFGLCLGVIFYSLPILLKVPHLASTDANTVITNWVGDIIWGLVLAVILRWLDNRTMVSNA